MALFTPKVSLKVDLTENRDFSEQQGIGSVVISSDIMSSIRILRENDMMSIEEYFLISKYENIFGRKHIHANRAEIIFNKEEIFEEEIHQHCKRCGKLLRIPWKRKRGLCIDCNYALKRQERCEIPWKEIKARNIPEDDRDVLRLR